MKTLLLLGDSLIEYGDWPGGFPDSRCLNFGIAGETVEGLLRRLPAVIQRVEAPDALVIMTGTNNLAMDDFYFVPRYEEILHLLAAAFPGAPLLVTSLLPVVFFWQPATLVPNLNSQLREMCSRLAVGYLDLHRLFLDSMDKGMPVFSEDGVHLSEAGYALWRTALQKRLPWL